MKNNLVIFLIFLSACYSGKTSENIRLKKELEAVLDTSDKICFGEDQFQIFSGRHAYLSTYQVTNDDSILLVEAANIDTSQFYATSSKLDCIGIWDENGGHGYDSVYPLDLAVPMNNEIYKFRANKKDPIFLTRDTIGWFYNLVVYQDGDTINKTIGYMGEGNLESDYFLRDITGDNIPEIFIVTHSMVGPNEVHQLQVYRITGRHVAERKAE